MSEPMNITPPREVTFTRNGPIPSFYTEGLSQLVLGFPTSRVIMHNMASRVSNEPDAVEVQNQVLEFVIPTPALVEMCKGILTHLGNITPELKEGGEQWTQNTFRLLDSIKAVTGPASQSSQ